MRSWVELVLVGIKSKKQKSNCPNKHRGTYWRIEEYETFLHNLRVILGKVRSQSIYGEIGRKQSQPDGIDQLQLLFPPFSTFHVSFKFQKEESIWLV